MSHFRITSGSYNFVSYRSQDEIFYTQYQVLHFTSENYMIYFFVVDASTIRFACLDTMQGIPTQH